MPHECTTCGRKFDDGSKEMLSGCPNCGGNKFQFQPAGRGSGQRGSSGKSGSSTAEPPAGTEDPTPAAAADEASADDPVSGVDATDPTADPATESTADVEREMSELSTDDTAGADAANTSTDDPAGATARSGFDDEFEDAEIADERSAEDTAQNDARTSQATLDEITEARRKMEEAADERLSEVGDGADEGGRGTPQGPPRDPPSGEETEAFDISGAVGPEDGDPVEKQPVGGSTGEPAEPVTDEDTDLSALREELNDQFESIKITAPGQYELNLMELYDRKEYIISLQEDGRYVIEMADDYGIDED